MNAVKDGKDMDAIEYIVEDTGCGIKPEDMEKLFDSYGRVNLERNRRVEGTGLGMGIVTGLLEAMNSKLQVESQYGKGSRFSFVLAQNYVKSSPVTPSLLTMLKSGVVLFLYHYEIIVRQVLQAPERMQGTGDVTYNSLILP